MALYPGHHEIEGFRADFARIPLSFEERHKPRLALEIADLKRWILWLLGKASSGDRLALEGILRFPANFCPFDGFGFRRLWSNLHSFGRNSHHEEIIAECEGGVEGERKPMKQLDKYSGPTVVLHRPGTLARDCKMLFAFSTWPWARAALANRGNTTLCSGPRESAFSSASAAADDWFWASSARPR